VEAVFEKVRKMGKFHLLHAVFTDENIDEFVK